MFRKPALLCTLLLGLVGPASASAAPASRPASKVTLMPPLTLSFDVPALDSTVKLSAPAWIGATVEETPYQLLQLCPRHGACVTLEDWRGQGGMTVSSDERLGLSPDRLYLIVQSMAGVNRQARRIDRVYYSFYGLREASSVAFRTASGRQADSGVNGWAPGHPHALEMAEGHLRSVWALPVTEIAPSAPASDASAR